MLGRRPLPLLCVLFPFMVPATAQTSPDLAAMVPAVGEREGSADEDNGLAVYDRFLAMIGGDSVRTCNGYPCIGWVEDRWPEGALKHRGYYDNGHLILFKNYFRSGALERAFKRLDDRKCVLKSFHGNGRLRSEALYVDGASLEYADYYPSGQMRYREEKDRSEPYYTVMDLFAENGTPLSTLHLVDKKHMIFEQHEYHANGQVHVSGRAQYDPGSMDSKRIGTWSTFGEDGKLIQEEKYVEGKLNATTTY